MKKAIQTFLVGITAVAATMGPATASAASPGAETEEQVYVAPRGPNGNPDLNGVWQVLNTANYDIQAHTARAAMAMAPGQFGPIPSKEVVALGAVGSVPAGFGVVEGDEIPYQDWAAAKKIENQQNWLQSDPEIKCYLPGVPRATYMPYPFQIFHSEQAIFFAYEYAGATRNIYLTDPGEAPTDSWMGQSFGHWEGDTLVIEVSGFNGQTWLDRAGNFHSDALHVVERYTPNSDNTMYYEATISDANVFTRPWKMSMTLYRRVGRDAQLQQFKCVEFVEELMYGDLRKVPSERIQSE
ncbi:MAG: hypothetical protein O7E57_05725 [Gammaproteobacteria bacterium]|nr:hypothetical protein [Gammaproteobacteria bacterium]